ncbi:MAG: DUF4383 domain-containing protein [Thermoleophilia bacterium]|nr:DUF4383 domain-containing protein [Thermoleophilia bacterium]
MERIGYTRVYATVTGTVLVLLGLFGILSNSEFEHPELTSELFGFFTVNGTANGFHIAAGLLALVLARPAPRLYALLAAIGFLGLGIWGVQADNGELLFGQLPAERTVNLFNLLLGAGALLALTASYWDLIANAGQTFEQKLKDRRIRRKKRKRAKLQRVRARSGRAQKPTGQQSGKAENRPGDRAATRPASKPSEPEA